MGFPIETTIDADACIGCGECLRVCPTDAFAMEGDKAVVSGEESIGCDHCSAVCPSDAVEIAFVDDRASSFSTFTGAGNHVPPGAADTNNLVALMRSRRSCRNYLDRPVERNLLDDLVKVGTTAPSGTNSQAWTFTVLPRRRAVFDFAQLIADFYTRLNKRAANPWMRAVARVVAGDALGKYYRGYHDRIEDGLRQWREDKRDRLFHGAPAVIAVGATADASCPAEDALLASGNMILAAHAMGLGTCLVGFAVEAIKRDARLRAHLGLEAGERVYSVIAVGWPNETWQRAAGRRAVTPRWIG